MKTIKVLYITVALSLLISSFNLVASASPNLAVVNPDSLFYEANTLYAKNEFGAAVQKYEELIHSGYQSGNLYFNLGNAYYKTGKKGLAVLYYEKARRLMPWDADLKANLTYAGAQNGWDRGIHGLGYLMTVNQAFLNASIWFFGFIAVFAVMFLWPAKIRSGEEHHLAQWYKISLIVAGSLFVFSAFLAGMTYFEQNQPTAVVIGRENAVRFEPNPQGTEYYRLGEGAVVKILDRKDGWTLIQRADHKRGWIQNQKIMSI